MRSGSVSSSRKTIHRIWILRLRLCLLIGASFATPIYGQDAALADPMRPKRAVSVTAGAAPEPRIRLQGVLRSATRRVAVINGRLYREGNRVGDAVLESIDSESIQLRRGSEIVVLYVETPGSNAPRPTGVNPK